MEGRRGQRVITFKRFLDERGSLFPVEGDSDVPFEIKRIFFIRDVPEGKERANHAHHRCQQVIVAINGRCFIDIDGEKHFLDSPNMGVFVDRGEVVKLSKFSHNAIVLVLCSEHYDPLDYVEGT